MRQPHTGIPFTVADFSDAELAAALDETAVPALLLACVHMLPSERRREILDGGVRPQGLYINELQGFMSPEDQTAARALALDIVRDWRDRGCPEPEPVSDESLHEMMAWLACDAVADEYLPMMLDELGFDGRDHRAPAPVSGAEGYPVVVIGAGMSGVLAAIRLGQAGFPYVVLEKNSGVGGTWFENTYPGARVDVASHFYSYSFETSDHWPELFSQAPELRAYFQGVAERYGVVDHVRFDTEVVGASWDESTSTWLVELGDGTTLIAKALISAVGQLNQPSIPDFAGSFDGPAFHTARWRSDVDLSGKSVVMIGAGATGFQLAPAIADQVGSLTVIQRSAQWMFPNPGYHDAVGEGNRWALKHLPFYGRWFRFLVMWPMVDTGLIAAKVDPTWEHQERSVSEVNEMVRDMFTDWIKSQVDDDELLAKVIPPYPPTGKRTLQDNGSWLTTLQRDNVHLVRAGVDRLEADGVVDSDGVKHPADVVIYATGYQYNNFLTPLNITGRGGVDLRQSWGIRARAHMGVTVTGFPNLFLLFGPGTNFAGGSSIVFGSECAVTYTMACLRLLAEGDHRAMDLRQEVYDDWYQRLQDEMRTMVWASPHIEHNYYKNADGDVHGVNPFRFVDYWGWTREADSGEYVLS
ncbi:MAG: NAD(P)/FAD-dependent oxidoreductase [Nocardioides sp.]